MKIRVKLFDGSVVFQDVCANWNELRWEEQCQFLDPLYEWDDWSPF
jgi:hypothetical protein